MTAPPAGGPAERAMDPQSSFVHTTHCSREYLSRPLYQALDTIKSNAQAVYSVKGGGGGGGGQGGLHIRPILTHLRSQYCQTRAWDQGGAREK